MLHYLIELAVWMLATFFVGCCIGCLLRKLFGAEAAVEVAAPAVMPKAAIAVPAVAAAATIVAAAPALRPVTPIVTPQPVVPPQPIVAATPLAATGVRMERPRGIAAARGGKADDLLRIAGVGPKNEKILHSLGFYHFDQIADWNPGQVAWVDDHLRFNGRIGREEWINQARLLRDGKEAEFTRLYGDGGLHRASGSLEPLVASQVKVVAPAVTLKSAETVVADDEKAAASGKMAKPKGLTSARGGKADNLQRISGVGPKNETILHGLGFFHFDQIAAWTATEVNWVDDHLRFGGRIKREEWIRQARLLAEGKDAEFAKLYGSGGLSKSGEQVSGLRTRKV